MVFHDTPLASPRLQNQNRQNETIPREAAGVKALVAEVPPNLDKGRRVLYILARLVRGPGVHPFAAFHRFVATRATAEAVTALRNATSEGVNDGVDCCIDTWRDWKAYENRRTTSRRNLLSKQEAFGR